LGKLRKDRQMMDRLYIIAIAVVIVGALSGGVYSVAGMGNSGSIVINRFTGACDLTGCMKLRY
jgi:hypothetical protein